MRGQIVYAGFIGRHALPEVFCKTIYDNVGIIGKLYIVVLLNICIPEVAAHRVSDHFSAQKKGMKMADAGNTRKADLILVTEIVRNYLAKNRIAVDQIGPLITMVHRTLSGLGGSEPAPAPEAPAPAVPIRRSVQPDYVVCLECGFRAKTLRRHLRVRHGFDTTAYRERWNLKPDHPVTAPAYSSSRSVMARQIGLGRNRSVTETSPAPTRRGRPRRLHA